MKKYSILALIFSAGILVGCAAPQKPKFYLTSTFDKAQADRLLQKGTNTIKGSALMRQVGGGVVSCAGQAVTLVPSTAYARERMRYLYGNEERGYLSSAALQMNPTPFENSDPAYASANRQVQCDAQGNFKFDGVADGDFHLISQITWKANPNSLFFEGGTMMRFVKLQGGETKELVIAP